MDSRKATKVVVRIFAIILLVAAFSVADRLLATATVGFIGARIITCEGISSYYSYECADLPMANGKPFDPEKRTCARWFYKFGTVLLVRSLDTGRVTQVVVTDRGPNKRLVREGRIIDLSKRAFQDICPLEKGLTRVAIAVKK
jgi:rare lipoprotein A (peptidoglycan hydrolase)